MGGDGSASRWHPTGTRWLDQSSRPPFSKAEGEGSRESSPRTVPSMSKNESKKQIFLSYSGKDRSFVEQLYEDLRNEGYRLFFDCAVESLPIGAGFSELKFQSARECDIVVVVLSEEYLLSKGRMLELVTCLNAQKLDSKKKIFPLFYKIVLSALKDVETQRRLLHTWETYAKEDARIDPMEWLDAVRALLNINELVFDDVSDRKEIVRSIYNFCPPDVEFDLTDMVGVERLCQLVAGKLDQKRKDGRDAILGFYGMGGLGKTTLCKALCNHFQQDFNGRVYYLDFGSGDALAILEEALRRLTNSRSDLILDGLKNEVQVDHMLIRLMEVLPLQDVFVAIDNLPSKMDLRILRLVRILLWYLNKDSMCIVTSRSAETLTMLPYLGNIMPCPSLTESEATNVFVRKALPGRVLSSMTPDESEVVRTCVNLCVLYQYPLDHHVYHPMALEALGYSLQGVHNQDPLEWKRQNAIPKKMAGDDRTRIYAIIGKLYSTLNDPDKLLFRTVGEFALDSERLLDQNILLKQLSVALNTNERDIRQRLEKFESLSILKVGEVSIAVHDLFIDFVHYEWMEKWHGEMDEEDAWEEEWLEGLSGGGGGSPLRIKPAMRSESEEPQPEIEHARASLGESGPLGGPLPPATRSEIVPKIISELTPVEARSVLREERLKLELLSLEERISERNYVRRVNWIFGIITVILSNLLHYCSFGEVSLPLLVASGSIAFILGNIDYPYTVLVWSLWYTYVICPWTLALLGTLWTNHIPNKDILIETFMEIQMLIHSFGSCIGSYIPFIGFIFFVVTWSISIYAPSGYKVEVVWKYNFWRFLGMIFKSNNSQLLKFADFVRKIFPHFAPCNALQDDVSCSTKTSRFITSTHGGGILGLVNSYPIVALDHYSKKTFSNQGFQIGAGSVHITKLSEDQFHFQCEVRGEVLEDIVAITNWERIAIVLSILQFWETSPKVGVIENLIHGEGGIYCHALSIKEILQGVHRSLDYFSIFQLQEPKQFFVGCGGEAVSMSHDKANGGRETSSIVAVMGAVGVYYQLRDSYNDVAVISLVVLSVLAILIFVLDFFGHLFKKSCFYGITTILCCGSTRGRLGIYRWLKKRNSSLPYCDEFKPDQLQLDDHSKEATILSELDYVRRRNMAVAQTPNWGELGINVAATNPCNWGELELDTNVQWLNRRLGGVDVYFQLYIDDSNKNVVFQMVKEGRTVLARSEYHDLRAKSLNDTMTTEVSVDEHARLYKWTAGSFYLFVYLMLKWRATDLGVIERFEPFMFRTYYHVFCPHGLASHIRDHNLHSYHLLPRD